MTPIETFKRWFQKKEGTAAADAMLSPDKIRCEDIESLLGKEGFVQLSGILPFKDGASCEEATRYCIEKWGFRQVSVVQIQPLAPRFFFFIAFGVPPVSPKTGKGSAKKHPSHSFDVLQLQTLAAEKIGRRLTLAVAPLEVTGHLPVFDAIVSLRGYAQEKGLEAYPCFNVVRLPAPFSLSQGMKQLETIQADIVLFARPEGAEKNLGDVKALSALFRDYQTASPHLLLKAVWNWSATPAVIKKAGFDAAFAASASPNQVAQTLIETYAEKSSPH